MKYLKKTFSYLKKNFWLPVAVMIAPAVVACFLSTPYWEVSFVSAFDMSNMSVKATGHIMFGDSWQFIWPVVVIAVFQIAGTTLIMSAVDKHFKTGKLSLRMPLRLINNTVFPITAGVVVMCAFSILWRLAEFGLTSLAQVVCGAFDFVPQATVAVIGILVVVLFFFHVLITTPMLFWAPTMFIYGYGFRDAAATSFKMISGKKVFRGLFVPLSVCAAVQMLVGFLNPYYAVACVVNFIVFLATNVFVPVYVMVSFYEISGLDRRDVKPYENIPLPPVELKKPSGAKPKTEKKSDKRIDKADAKNNGGEGNDVV